MIVDPKKSFKWLKHSDPENIQQSGIDLRLDKILRVGNFPYLGISSKGANHEAVDLVDGWYELAPGTYDFQCFEYVEVPIHCCALIIQRSSLNRIGAFITTGLYDNSFHNYVGGILHVPHFMKIQHGTRIAQIVFIKSESRRKYRGQYNGKLQSAIS